LDNANVHPGEVPWYFKRFVSKDFEGITRGNNIYFRPDVDDPCKISGLAKLGHELVHVGQYGAGNDVGAVYFGQAGMDTTRIHYEKPAYDKEDETHNTMPEEKCGRCPKQ
jgi:Domain of unknown function (DUF4157)